MVGVSAQAIVALDDRLLIVKAGIMAGATGGGRITEFRYRDILGIQVNTGITTATIIVQTAGVNTTSGDYWATHSLGHASRKDDPWKLPNAIPTNKQLLKRYGPDLEHIRERVRRSGEPLDGRRRPCPWCAEMIQPAAKVCRYCGRNVDDPTSEPPPDVEMGAEPTLRCATCGSQYIAGTVLCADCMSTDLRSIEAP